MGVLHEIILCTVQFSLPSAGDKCVILSFVIVHLPAPAASHDLSHTSIWHGTRIDATSISNSYVFIFIMMSYERRQKAYCFHLAQQQSNINGAMGTTRQHKFQSEQNSVSWRTSRLCRQWHEKLLVNRDGSAVTQHLHATCSWYFSAQWTWQHNNSDVLWLKWSGDGATSDKRTKNTVVLLLRRPPWSQTMWSTNEKWCSKIESRCMYGTFEP